MDLNPELRDFLEQGNMLSSIGDDTDVPVEPQRKGFETAFGNIKSKVPVKSITDESVPGPGGNRIPIRVYQPDSAKPRKQGLPILVYFHGGCFFVGSICTHNDFCRNIGRLSGYIVISVGYRLAPEHKFPAGHEDCYAATQWAHSNASTFGGDASHLAVGGDSAGGCLAAAVCLMARDRNGPSIALQILLYPMLQPTMLYDSKSLDEFGPTPPILSKKQCANAYDRLVTNPEEAKSELLDVNHAPSLGRLPPAHVVTAEYDVLRDEGEYFAARLAGNNVPVTAKRYPGTVHGFMLLNSLAEIAISAEGLEDVANAMRQAVKDEPYLTS